MTWENRLTFEVSSADPDSPTPVWVDLTTRIRDGIQPVTSQSGRQNDLDQSEPGRLDGLLENADDALTYGNTASPYPWWGPGRKCRLRETVGGFTMDRFTGYLQVPTESLVTSNVEQRVAITAVDRLGRLASAEPFVSTVTAHIKASGNGALVAYWPLLDAAQPFRPVVGTGNATVRIATGSVTPLNTQPTVTPRGGAALPGDDVAPVSLAPGTRAGVNVWSPYLATPTTAALVAGQVATAVVWLKADVTSDLQVEAIFMNTDGGLVDLLRRATGSGGDWRITSPLGTLTGNVASGITVGNDVYYILGLRYGFTPNVLEMWVNDLVYTATLSGAYVGTNVVGQISAGSQLLGSIAHLQFYAGDPSLWTHTDFLAQRQVGLYGRERETTGDRIRAIARYAGVPESELLQIDKGCSVMQAATLAGQDPLAAMRDAERTEQGLLYVDGSGNLVFKDRRSLYNI